MRKMYLVGVKEEVLDNGMRMQLEYYLLEEKRYQGDTVTPLYGVEIAKNQKDEREVESIAGISYSKEKAMYVVDTLMKYTVTPYAAAETIDDMMSLAL